MKMLLNFALFLLFFTQFTAAVAQNVMANTLDAIPAGWAGKKFQMSKNYPTTNPAGTQPWKSFNFQTQPLQYVAAVKQYVLEGNIATDWVFQNNTVRKWYHAPSMIWAPNGREFINGMTRERSSRPGELHPGQTSYCQNWAVGFYNPKGGYTLGKVYKIPTSPDATQAIFPEGTVAAKLLFTNAALSEVPYLQNSFVWQANINTAQSGTTARSPAPVRLLQMDVAIKDNRAGATTDWVMITFVYNNNAPGATAWDKLVPAGIEWGNDPTSIASGGPLTQTWINPAYTALFTFGNWTIHTGYLGRLNGPVDNPKSSCLSCHGTAQIPSVSTGMVPSNTPASTASYFRNINPPNLFEDKPGINELSLDYSLQLTVGIPPATQMHANRSALAPPLDSPSVSAIKNVFLTTRDFEREIEMEQEVHDAAPSKNQEIHSAPIENAADYSNWLIGGGLAALTALAAFLFRKRK